jgi:hypothetical protein
MADIWVPIVLDISDTCPFFQHFSFCIATYLFLQLENFQER